MLGGNDGACICDTVQVEEEGKCKLFPVISSVRRDRPLSCRNVGNSLRRFCAFPAYKTGLTSIGCGSFSIASQTMINVEASAPGQIHGVVLGTMLAVNCAEPMTNKGTSAGSRQF